ncbi:MAG: exodeoxyribonuclease III [Betaproteobacteria bacterium RIFCSPLOWO2_12_FULL_63_13]|nr:MAG: exodeoxyribonuclease III [Betaproteobacteria bacterium RIFCSPLOWO2_02_FULL_63_19]OGA45124.1 MAG: exodeoxyribonuclease III [Betaproteobacteria bacterium RIFCSPLOWO2_12_FULL_63_13]
MRIATWNVNSLKVRLPHVLDWIARHSPDVVCLQELKLEDAKFPRAPIEDAGYQCAISGQKTYNGVAILARHPLAEIMTGIPGFDDPQKRIISATVEQTRIVCAYVPNGQSVGSDKYEYKLRWLAALQRWLRDELLRRTRLVVAGDYNIAPEDRDVYDPEVWEGQVLCSGPERDAFKGLLALGFTDSFRLFEQPEKSFSWWDYRMNGFRRNLGLRIDHILLSEELARQCERCSIDLEPRRLDRPSDHAPVVAEIRSP